MYYTKEMMHCHRGTNNRAPQWTSTDSRKPEARPGAREEPASPAWPTEPAINACDTTKVYIWRLDTGWRPRPLLGPQETRSLLQSQVHIYTIGPTNLDYKEASVINSLRGDAITRIAYRRTDRRTDRRTERQRGIALARLVSTSRAKNSSLYRSHYVL